MLTLRKLNNSGAIKNMASLIFSTGFLLLVIAALLNRQGIDDYLKLRNYTPPAEIVALADQTTMDDDTRRVFFVNQPVVQDKAAFKQDCPNGGGEKTIVLGCYKSGQNGIYLLQVTDERLDGVKQVTAAHELLHAAYDRLSSSERKRIDGLLTDYFNNELKDERIKKTIDGYRKTEPNDLINEMHSIFPTEIAKLPAELEEYYKQYFTDRSQIIKFADQYQAEFTSRQDAIVDDEAQLVVLKKQIDDYESALDKLQAEIITRQQDLTSRQRNGDIEGYNAGVAGFNALIDRFNGLARELQATITQHNQIVERRNAIASEISELSNALSTDVKQMGQQ